MNDAIITALAALRKQVEALAREQPGRLTKVSVLPVASAAYRGRLLRVEGGAGVADALYICEYTAANTYNWRQL